MNTDNLTFHSKKALSIVQFRTSPGNTFEYISLSNAIKNKYVEVKEVSESGSVNDLSVENTSKHFVFISDGDILSGAKQNRVMNTSVLISPESKIRVPVSCVESGRWRYESNEFEDTDYSAPSFLRSSKAAYLKNNLKKKKSFYADQSEIWDEVSEYEFKHQYNSASSNLSDIYEYKREDFTEFIKSFKPEKDANGIAIFIRNKLLNLEIFNRSEIYEEYFTKLLKGAYFETSNLIESDKRLEEAEAKYKTLDFMDRMEMLNYEEHKGVGVGTESRFDTEEMTGFKLSYESNLIHFVALNLKRDEEKIITTQDGRKVLNFGKYKGRTIDMIQMRDPEYLKWLCFESGIDRDIKKEIYEEVLKRW